MLYTALSTDITPLVMFVTTLSMLGSSVFVAHCVSASVRFPNILVA